MKFKIKALCLTLVLSSLVGACSSVNSSTPSVDDPAVNSGIELETPEGIEGVEEVPGESAEMDTSDYQTSDESNTGLESGEMDNSSIGSSEEPTTDLDSAEMETPDYEASGESTTELESVEMDNSDLETAGQEAPEIESSEAPLDSSGTEVILPVEDAQTPTESEAAENSNLEPAQ